MMHFAWILPFVWVGELLEVWPGINFLFNFIRGFMFCMFLFNRVNYLFLRLRLCILIVMYTLFCVFLYLCLHSVVFI
jgi:hypothetical protein